MMTNAQAQFIRHEKKYRLAVTFTRTLLFVILLALWEITTKLSVINPFIFSSPSRIVNMFLKMCKDGSIFHHCLITIGETALSFAIIIIAGIGIAVILWLCKGLSDVLEPYLIILNSLPKSALAPMLIVWLGNNQKAIIVTAISVAIFGTILNIYTGFLETNKEQLRLIKTLGGSSFTALTKLVLPSSRKIIISNLKVNIGLCLVGVIIGEFLAARAGLGYLIIYGSQVFKMDLVAMSIVLLCFICAFLYKLIDFIERKSGFS
ncbi:MAG: ABC transporter permease [Eubacteriales bacterium]|nr:ABC transporter permease [Eubacteriales bacterium]